MTCLLTPTSWWMALPGSSTKLRLMSTAIERFHDTGEWASLSLLQNDLVDHYDFSNASREAERLPAKFGRKDEGDRLVLTVIGIFTAEPNHRIIDDFERSLRVLLSRYRKRRDPRVPATISASDLEKPPLHFGEMQAERTLLLMREETLISADDPEHGEFLISPEIRHFLRVRDVKSYLAVRAKRDRQRCRAKKRNAVSGATIRDRMQLKTALWAVATALLITLALWLAQEAFSGEKSSNPARDPAAAGVHEPSQGKQVASPGTRAGRPPPAPVGRR